MEAALTRVKRASENASRAALPKIEPAARSIHAQGALAVDRQATARALAPATEVESRVEPLPAPRPELVQSPLVKPSPVEPVSPEKQRSEAVAVAQTPASQPLRAEAITKPLSKLVLDELEPLDYLEAEIRKVDKALGAEFLRNESPSTLTHAVISGVDLIAIALSCSPFLAIMRISDGSFSNTRTRLATVGIVALISFFYLALTQSLCGRTFGMMLTNTRVVDELTYEPPSASRALLRTAGYFAGAAPAMIGIIWAGFNRKHRGWQDFLSGTIVVRDF